MHAPCSAFISFTETHSATQYSMLSITGLSSGLRRSLLFVFVLCPEPACRRWFTPTGLLSCSIFFEVLVRIQILRISALHHLPEFCHYEPQTSSFLVNSFNVFPENTVPLSHHNFYSGHRQRLRCISSIRFFTSSSSSLLFRSSTSWSLIILLSLSSCFSSVAAASIIVKSSVSLFVLSLPLSFQVSDFSFTVIPSAPISAEIFSTSPSTWQCPTHRANLNRLHHRLAVAIGTLFSRTNPYFALFHVSRSWHVSGLLLSSFVGGT